jgi:hypothetical protein
MTPKGLKHILKRVELWPAAAQQEALQSLRAIEEDFTGPEIGAELDQLDQETLRGEGVSHEQHIDRLGL